jgi:hypothetical protein
VHKQILKTFALGLWVVGSAFVTGCFTSNEPANNETTLSISMGLKDVNKGGALSKGATISYKKLIVTMVSNATTPDTLRDTITPGHNGFTAVATDSQTVSKTYGIKPLRSWTITVKTLDQKDSVIHSANTTANSILIGENRTVSLTLTSKFVMYVAKFVLPDSLSATGSTTKQVLNINRFVMKVDGRTVVDSTKPSGYFAATPTVNSIQFDYIKADTAHSLELYIYGVIPNWPSNKPLFGDTIAVAPTGRDSTYTPTLPWMGPGSPDDPNYDPLHPTGATAGLEIHIGKVGTVTFEPVVNGNLFKSR